ncbi:helix-turn-helix domain-containing protein [Streptomyces sp. NPDC088147]|uniref:helix-turn-helix domain-containing protein n=1 Tax=unclassified Streptomyces TaxID=2593676 RepID=UPI003820739D
MPGKVTSGLDMVAIGRDGVRHIGFKAPDGPGLELEVLDRAEIGRRAVNTLGEPHRTGFHRLMLVDAGQTWHEVDFVEYRLGPGTVLWVRPGQVQRFGPPVDGELVLFTDEAPASPSTELARLLGDIHRGPAWRPGTAAYAGIREMARQLRLEADCHTASGDEARRHLLSVMLLRIGRTDTDGPALGDPDSVAARFAAAVERDFARTHRVADYAGRLGYSVRTLTRASTAATGLSARELLDARITLEAKRLLAYTDLAVAAVSHRLGFSEPTNFGKFFLRRTGRTPAAFRRTFTR